MVSRYVRLLAEAFELTGIGQLGKFVMGDLSKESEVRVSCQTQVHQSLRLIISRDLTSGDALSLPSDGVGRCSPRDCARRQVRPVSAHEASAFMSLSKTKLVRSKACIESKDGLRRKLPSRRKWNEI